MWYNIYINGLCPGKKYRTEIIGSNKGEEKMSKKISIGNLIKRTPNWTATILVILIIGTVYCYFGGDLIDYRQAANDRTNLAEQAAEAVLYETGLNMNAIEEEMQNINQRIQRLSNSTDLGEYIAANDLTVEGRKTNANILNTTVAMIIILVTYFILNFVRMFWWFAFGRKRESKGKFSRDNS